MKNLNKAVWQRAATLLAVFFAGSSAERELSLGNVSVALLFVIGGFALMTLDVYLMKDEWL